MSDVAELKEAIERAIAPDMPPLTPDQRVRLADAARRWVRVVEGLDYIAAREWLKHKHGLDLSLNEAKAVVVAAVGVEKEAESEDGRVVAETSELMRAFDAAADATRRLIGGAEEETTDE